MIATDPEETPVSREKLITLKDAKHDVRRYGIKGLDEESKESAKIALLVQLGAKVSEVKAILLPYLSNCLYSFILSPYFKHI